MEESRKQFEYEAGQALCLPTSIIELARKGDGYDHAFDSMNIMQPLNGWWAWWKKSRAAIEIELPKEIELKIHACSDCIDVVLEEAEKSIRAAGLRVKEK